MSELRFDSSMDVFLSGDPRSKDSIDKLGVVMDDEHTVMVVLTVPDLFSDEGARVVDEVGRSIEEIEGIDRVLDLVRAQRFVRAENLGFDPSEWIQFESFLPRRGLTDEEWDAQQVSVTAVPWARDLLVSRDGQHAMSIIDVSRSLATHADRVALRDEIEAKIEPFRARLTDIHVGAFPFIEAEVQEGLEADVERFVYVLPALLAAILLIAFRSLSLLAIVVAFEAAGVGVLPILFVCDGSPINLYTAMLFPLVAGLQLTFLTHLLSTLKRRITAGEAFRTALPASYRHVLAPSTVALITTVLGLSALLTCDVGLVSEVGRLGGIAVTLVFVVTFLPPAVLILLLRRRPERELVPAQGSGAFEGVPATGLRSGSMVERLCGFVSGRARWIVAGAFLVVLACLPASSLVRTDLRAIEFLDESSPSRQGLEFVDRRMGGMNVFELSLDAGEPGAVSSYEALSALERIEKVADDIPAISNIYTYAQVFAQANRVWNKDDPDSERVPENGMVRSVIETVLSRQSSTFDDVLYDPTKQFTTIYARTEDMPSTEYLAAVKELEARATAEVPEGMTLSLGQGLHTVLESDRRIVDSQVRSLFLASLAVWVTLFALLRSVRLATAAVLSSVPALGAILALLGYGGVPLNSVTVMVAAILLGIAVDDSIHFLAMWREQERNGASRVEVLRTVLAHKFLPMACTTAVLIAGMGMFLGASFPPIADFGLASVLALAVAFASALTVLPALLLLGAPGFASSRSSESVENPAELDVVEA